jgi:hypothetical protein
MVTHDPRAAERAKYTLRLANGKILAAEKTLSAEKILPAVKPRRRLHVA